MAVLPLLALLCAVIAAGCSSDEPPTPDPSSDYNSVIINPDGTATGNAVFSRIDETTFFLDYVKYKIYNSHLNVVGYDVFELPEEPKLYAEVQIDGTTYKTRTIAAEVFSETNIKAITIPSTVMVIGHSCFEKCKKLVKIDMPGELEALDSYCFYECSALEEVTLSKNLSKIGYSCFEKCENLIKIDIPDAVEELPSHCFYKCRALEEVTLSKNLSYIGGYCFSGCTNLKRVTFKGAVPRLTDGSFMTPHEGEYTPEAYVPINYLPNYHNSPIRDYFYQIHGYE